eukprot:2554958-Amphidinium_carterae.1
MPTVPQKWSRSCQHSDLLPIQLSEGLNRSFGKGWKRVGRLLPYCCSAFLKATEAKTRDP